ncbi:DEAD/DEAH box helicase [Acidaminobacter hydrogenoformans]|uniref:Superfamily II DNA and RNA helicase n=1 Tax=Acidaminobacter hydrogenoformans DSM 2784 TaxID=1120920 RepID=A0A1G5S6L4_9FIRM|nr:DEAD/DEAH box helicase [Acidaminobacter hydrogenoformans]SCZ82004.1 Superfamily II DNA and RNA helicase [Acidaminobacter hydrogenoformans DSM 2784]
MIQFKSLGISAPLLTAIDEIGFETPTEVQVLAVPKILNQEDLIIISKTGSGKTAAFGLPILQLTTPGISATQALILTPTRELAIQVDHDIMQMAKHLSHRTTAIYGQHNINTEIKALSKFPEVVTGTPGRVYDHIQRGQLKLDKVKFLVIDEADRMLDMGFIDQVVRIIKKLPKDRVTLLFSATMPEEVRRMCKAYMKSPSTIEIESETKTVDLIDQAYYRVQRSEKRTQLDRLLQLNRPDSCLIFCNTRHAVDSVQSFLHRQGYASMALHGEIPQNKRQSTIEKFKKSDFHLLVATDVAARGIHIEDLSLVINYDVPEDKDSYVHRIGRTGRAGNTGRAITLVTGEDLMTLYEIEEHINAMISEEELPTDAALAAIKDEVTAWKKTKSVPAAAPSKATSAASAGSAPKGRGTRPPRRPKSDQAPQGRGRSKDERPSDLNNKKSADSHDSGFRYETREPKFEAQSKAASSSRPSRKKPYADPNRQGTPNQYHPHHNEPKAKGISDAVSKSAPPAVPTKAQPAPAAPKEKSIVAKVLGRLLGKK